MHACALMGFSRVPAEIQLEVQNGKRILTTAQKNFGMVISERKKLIDDVEGCSIGNEKDAGTLLRRLKATTQKAESVIKAMRLES